MYIVDEQKNTVVVDFDGVIAEYDHWRGADVFGKPVPYGEFALQEFMSWGWRVVIYTTREVTTALLSYFKDNHIVYHGINDCRHNPPGCSNKPIATVYLDDRSWNDVGRRWCWKRVMRRMRKLYQPRPKTSEIDNAADWDLRGRRDDR